MKTIKISEATEPQLNWLVASIEYPTDDAVLYAEQHDAFLVEGAYTFTTDPAEFDHVVERDKVSSFYYDADDDGQPCTPGWGAAVHLDQKHLIGYGPTRLIASVRGWLLHKNWGDEMQVPEWLS